MKTSGEAITAGGGGNGNGPPGPVTGGGDCNNPPSGGFAFCAASGQVLHLGVSKALSATLTAASNFEGDVALTIERSDLNAIDTKARVNTQLGQAQVHLNPGQRATIPIMVQASTLAPTVNSHFRVIASRVGDPGSTSSADVPLQIQPIYDVFLHGNPTQPGAAPETWDADPPGTPAQFAPHPEGLTINFYNMDTASNHIIHGTGIITHQNTGMPLVKSPGGGVPGGVYTLKFTETTPQTGTFYCHTHESSTEARTIEINQP